MTFSMFFSLYIFSLAPLFAVFFIKKIREDYDVTLTTFLLVLAISILPFLRELLFFQYFKFGDRVLFKKVE